MVGLAEGGLREWLDHRRDVLLRRSRHRQAEIEHRLEVLAGMLIAYLNLDLVITIIRKEDEPKPVLMKLQALRRAEQPRSSTCGCAICAGSRKSRSAGRTKDLSGEEARLEELLGARSEQWKSIAAPDPRAARSLRADTTLGRRRTSFGEAPESTKDAIRRR